MTTDKHSVASIDGMTLPVFLRRTSFHVHKLLHPQTFTFTLNITRRDNLSLPLVLGVDFNPSLLLIFKPSTGNFLFNFSTIILLILSTIHTTDPSLSVVSI